MNWDENKFWLDVAQWVCMLVLATYGWITNRSNINRKFIESLEDDISSLELDITQIKEQSKHQPTVEDIRAIEQQVSALKVQVQASTHLLQTIHNHLLDGK